MDLFAPGLVFNLGCERIKRGGCDKAEMNLGDGEQFDHDERRENEAEFARTLAALGAVLVD
jgi:hypothetical protein